MEKLTQKEALEVISDGHTVINVKYAEEVCEALGVKIGSEFYTKVVSRCQSDPAGTFKGLTMNPGSEDSEGVHMLELSRYIADKLGVADKAGSFYGRGSQARAYAEQVAKAIGEKHG